MNKRRWLSVCLIVVLIGLAGLAVAWAQQPQPQKPKQEEKKKPGGEKTDPQDERIITETVNVRLPIAVMDKSKRFITNLKESDFQVYEDKVPQRIESFRAEADLPLD